MEFLPFGEGVGDNVFIHGDDGTADTLILREEVVFYQQRGNILFVSTCIIIGHMQ